jgi:hypothetical protein
MKNGTLILIQQQCAALNPKPVLEKKKADVKALGYRLY